MLITREVGTRHGEGGLKVIYVLCTAVITIATFSLSFFCLPGCANLDKYVERSKQ